MVLMSSFIIEHNKGLKVFFDCRNMSVKEKITHLLNKLKKNSIIQRVPTKLNMEYKQYNCIY